MQKLRRWLVRRRLLAYYRTNHTQPILAAIRKQVEPKPPNIVDITDLRKTDG